ncbi:PRC-barrel domain-containing protein [Acidovorax sp. A1169]|uniref:PRC-barrel domain-containing protein n=1 Tax=Acidovorax sp. A1169 TaxID=3059524 RepID=UPI002737EDA4|nr:PRC-barrel domain-containing protein [Acidovorax sp. A1169]MDP4076367.1 PRC-barrel domain-containing protein [Acidovorax sp. A1169]
MKNSLSHQAFAIVAISSALWMASPALAQVAGATTTVDATVTESIQLARGWSVKKTLLGKTIYNDAGKKVGRVDDLIISLDRNVSYVIVGAGGFVGIGRHDVAVPVSEIQDQAGKLVMAGATKESVKSMPEFKYATDTTKREQFVAAADKDIARGKAKVSDLEKKAGAATVDAKVRIDQEITSLQGDVKSAETKLTEMKQATVARWKEFEAGVSAATARLRKSIDSAAG